jgi:hypothetical protein
MTFMPGSWTLWQCRLLKSDGARTAIGLNSSIGRSQPRLLGHGGVGRALYFAHIADIDHWPDDLHEPEPHFGVLLAMDGTTVAAGRVATFANKLMDQGMVFVCAWGPACERVHDIVDVERTRRTETDDRFISTTWHGDEDLDDAVWFAVAAEVPSDAYIETCRAVIAIVVDQPEWSQRVEAALADFEAFSDAILRRN